MMKRFVVILSSICIIACMIVVGYPMHIAITDTNDLILKNIEALASGEGQTKFCYGTGDIYCNGRYVEFVADAR